MSTPSQIILINYLEELIEAVSTNECKKNHRLRGKTKKIVKLTNYLKAISKNQMEKN